MKIKLNSLILKNFKGINGFTLKSEGKNCLVRGDNGVGKTTLMDSFLWLIFGKDGNWKSDFALKTLNAKGQEIHNLDHSVEGALDIDGELISMKKVFTEKYTKKRGSARKEFTGHTTNYFINDVPVQKKEWDSKIGEIIDEETFKLLTSPDYFNSFHWKRRREILLQVCGDVSDEDVIASNSDLRDLPDILGDRSLDDHRKVVAGKKKEINDRLKEIPARIDELNNSLVDVSGYDKDRIGARIENLEGQIKTIKDDSQLSKLRSKKAELIANRAELDNVLDAAKRKAGKEADEKIRDIEKDIRFTSGDIDVFENAIETFSSGIEYCDEKIEKLRIDFENISTQEFSGDKVCSTCGQDIPEDQVETAIQKHNIAKAEKLSEINETGKSLQNENAERRNSIEELVKKKKEQEKVLARLEESKLEAEANNIEAVNSAGKKLKKEIESLNSQIAEIDEKIENFESETEDTTDLEEMLSSERTKLAEIEAAKKSKIRIDQLSEEEKILAEKYEELENQTFLMEKFIVSKVGMLEDKINSKFELARFKLFETQINEGIKETCTTLYNGVPFGYGLNTGAEINVGLDIVRTLSEHYGIKAPVFIDHAESVTEILDPGTQTIKLIVDETAKELDVEILD